MKSTVVTASNSIERPIILTNGNGVKIRYLKSVVSNHENDHGTDNNVEQHDKSKKAYTVEIVRSNVFLQCFLHSMVLAEIIYLFRYPEELSNSWKLFLFNGVYVLWSALGVTAGAHRLWAHRSYKAKTPLRIFLALGFCSAGQNDIYIWSRDHRVHHKYSETDADPHNAKRGFFFSHMGWLMVRKHPDVLEKGKNVDCSDLLKDPVVLWTRKYFMYLALVLILVIPTVVPYFFMSIPFWHCFFWAAIRYIVLLHLTWLVNSAAHLWGTKPYDRTIGPVEQNFWKIVNFTGEMYHNYHHTFPWDYKASEWGWFGQWNFAAFFIDCMATIGQAYDLKTTPKHIVQARKERTGQYAKSINNNNDRRRLDELDESKEKR